MTPEVPALPVLPWRLPDAGGGPLGLSLATDRELLPSAFAIAVLVAIVLAALHRVDGGVRVVVLDLRSVPVIDATGLVNLESAIERLRHAGIFVALAGVAGQPLRALIKAGFRSRRGEIAVCRSFDVAIERARRHVALLAEG